MRLRLVIYRHGLSPTRVVWTPNGLGATSRDASPSSATVSQFLANINLIIPLESEGYGLEDYVVEAGDGFELLHFQVLQGTVRDDEVLVIRPLDSVDRGTRRVSGRHQISHDGKRLIDGIPFGCSFYEYQNGRPPIRTPRQLDRRLAYEDAIGKGEELAEIGHELIAGADFEDAEDEEDSDYERQVRSEASDDPAGGDTQYNEAREDGLRASNQDQRMQVNAPGIEEDDGLRLHIEKKYSKLLWNTINEEPNQSPAGSLIFKTPRSPHLSHRSMASTYHDQGTLSSNPLKRKRQSTIRDESTSRLGIKKPARFDDEPENVSHRVRRNVSTTRTNGSAERDEVLEGNDHTADGVDSNQLRMIHREGFAEEGSGSSSDDSEELDESSEDSDEDSSDESSHKPLSPVSEFHLKFEPLSDNVKRRKLHGKPASLKTSPTNLLNSAGNCAPDSEVEAMAVRKVTPGEGLPATHARNARRQMAKRRKILIRTGQLPRDCTLDDVRLWQLRKGPSGARKTDFNSHIENEQDEELSQMGAVMTSWAASSEEQCPGEKFEQSTPKTEAFELRRQKLLEAIRSGGVEIDNPLSPVATLGSADDHAQGRAASELGEEASSAGPPLSSRRLKVDLASSRRMLFGSLGIRPPKTKEDESKIRADFMKLARPVKGAMEHPTFDKATDSVLADQQTVNGKPSINSILSNESQKPEAWRKAIKLSAVECCREGVVLSAPPFPFRQRWDAQQAYMKTGKRGGKRKKRERNDPQYYEDGSNPSICCQDDAFEGEGFHDLEHDGADLSNSTVARATLNDELSEAVNDQLLRDVNESIAPNAELLDDDLPCIPPNLDALAALKASDIKAGAVIVFKELTMSASWEPLISGYRTGRVEVLLGSDKFGVILAKRDQIQKQKVYDHETGDRIYGKFEMPDLEHEEDEGQADGYYELEFAELVDPKLLVPCSENNTVPTGKGEAP